MTGRGVDQILPHPGDPRLWEPSVRDATDYVRLAEVAHGPVPRPADPSWPWGDVLPLLAELAPHARVMNLETSVTRSDEVEAGKSVHYRMSPDNLPCLAAVTPLAWTLANNHVCDFGRRGLVDTTQALCTAPGTVVTGAGADVWQARQAAVLPLSTGGRVLVAGCGTTSSGIPPQWAATADVPGVDLLPDLSGATVESAAEAVAERVIKLRRPGDITVVSIHWGSNWGYEVPRPQIRFAHRLIDAGVDVVHGHSSHHPRPVEVYRGRLILYGCGDLVNDYEGIAGYERYRDDLRLLYLATLRPDDGELIGLRMAPLRARQLRLWRAEEADRRFLAGTLDLVSRPYGCGVRHRPDGLLELLPPG